MNQAQSFRRRVSRVSVGVALALSSLGMLVASSASAVNQPAPKVTGGVELSGPLQYASFSAFQTTPVKGSITYTNFSYAAPGSGVWNLSAVIPIEFTIGGTYDHTMTITSWNATSPNSITFTATGTYNPDPIDYTWTATGTVVGSTVTINLVYTGLGAGYSLALAGTIASDGSMSGTETGSSSGTWTSPADSAFEVFSFTAPVTCAFVDDAASPASATFGFTIPASVPLAGTPVVVNVIDGGSPGAGNDTWAHGVDTAPGACSGATTSYPIIGGNLVVH
ncbi:MAG TPA: hypothetical protein VMU68_03150 [Acidimicrobiales bacterium]|nr:hypothetical protein [Acidimicrobiales bacterium]